MFKQILCLVTPLFILLHHFSGDTYEGFYAAVAGGINFLDSIKGENHKTTFKTGYAAGFSLGCKFYDHIRLEGEWSYRRNNVKSIKFPDGTFHCGHNRSISLFANCLYDIHLCRKFSPYFGGGVGIDFEKCTVSAPGHHRKASKDRLALQAIAGGSYLIYPCIEMSIDYRYHWAAYHFHNHSVLLGFRYFI